MIKRITLVLGFTFVTYIHANVGHVSLLKGDATIHRSSKNIGALLDMNIENRDKISTKKDTKLQITFKDKTVITLGSLSTCNVDDYVDDNLNPKAKLSVTNGAFKVITGNIGKLAPRNFQFKTKTVTIGIRGTVFVGEIDKKSNKTYIACTKGSIVLESIKNNKNITLEAGKMVTILQDGTMENISNISSQLFSLIPHKNSQKIVKKSKTKDIHIRHPMINRNTNKKTKSSKVDAIITNSANIDNSTNVADGEDSNAEMGSITIK